LEAQIQQKKWLKSLQQSKKKGPIIAENKPEPRERKKKNQGGGWDSS